MHNDSPYQSGCGCERWRTMAWSSGLRVGVAAIAVLLVAGMAKAERINLAAYSNPQNVDLVPLDIELDVLDLDRAWGFLFTNESSVNASITDVYFERDFLDERILEREAQDRRIFETPNVNFTNTATPRLPMDSNVIRWQGNAFTFGANATGGRAFENGVKSFDRDDIFVFDDDDLILPDALLIAVEKSALLSPSQLADELGEPGTRIAIQVEGVGGSDTGVFGGDVGLVSISDDLFDDFFDDDDDLFDGDSIRFLTDEQLADLFGEDDTSDLFDRPNIGNRPNDIGVDSGLSVSLGFDDDDGGSVTRGVVTGPLPTAVWPGLALLAGLAMKRRRRLNQG